MSNISYIILSLESALSFLFGIILYVFPDLLLSYFLKNTDGVHWHMARVAGSVLLGESYTFWHWSKSTTASPVGAASFSRIITIAFGIAAFWNDAVGDNFLIQNTRMLSIVPIFLANDPYYNFLLPWLPTRQNDASTDQRSCVQFFASRRFFSFFTDRRSLDCFPESDPQETGQIHA